MKTILMLLAAAVAQCTAAGEFRFRDVDAKSLEEHLLSELIAAEGAANQP